MEAPQDCRWSRYGRPWVWRRYAPSPRATKNGSPPTAPKARTGELTPPGMRASARSKSDSTSGVEPLGGFARQVRQHEVGAGPLDRDQVLERDRVAVEPAELCGGFDHGVLTAHVERGDGEVERVAHSAD